MSTKRRDPATVRPVMMRMGVKFISQLDRLCKVNGRSRREICEILITEAALDLKVNKAARINPL